MNSVHVFLLCGAMLQMATSQITPSITFISPKQIGEVGGFADLQCSVKNAQDVPVVWSKVEAAGLPPIFISSGSALLVPDNRYSVRLNQTTWTYTLKIRNLQLQDAGLYRCVLNIALDNQPHADVEVEVDRQKAATDNK